MRLKPARDYRKDDAAVSGAWYASAGSPPATTRDAVVARANCSPGGGYRVAHQRQAGTPYVLSLWLEGTLTLRQVECIVTQDPFDPELQSAAACRASPIVRARAAGQSPGVGRAGNDNDHQDGGKRSAE